VQTIGLIVHTAGPERRQCLENYLHALNLLIATSLAYVSQARKDASRSGSSAKLASSDVARYDVLLVRGS
jgi:hypothetical protein